MIYVKIHKGLRNVVAISDESLIGKTLIDGNLRFVVSEYFYKGVKKTKEEVREVMKVSTNLNIIGKESIALALELQLITHESIFTIQGIPHAQILFC